MQKGKFIDSFKPGTRVWIIKKLKEWLYEPNWSQAFIILGLAGVGKSTLLWKICQDDTPLVLASHFFCHDDNKAKNLQTCLQNVAQRMSLVFPQAYEKIDLNLILEEYKNDLLTAFEILLIQPLKRVSTEDVKRALNGAERAVVVLDALDECKSSQRKVLLQMIESKWRQLPPWLGLIASARPEDYIPSSLVGFHPTVIDIESVENIDDVRLFLEEKVKVYFNPSSESYEDNVQEAIEILLKRSSGLFLYARFLDDMIRLALNPQGDEFYDIEDKRFLTLDIIKNPDLFPMGLVGVYSKYFQRLKRHLGGSKNYQKILGPVVAAREPLNVSIWEEICTSGVDSKGFNFQDIVIARTSNLLSIKDGKVRLLHKSMADYLKDADVCDQRLLIAQKEAHTQMAMWCAEKDNISNEVSRRNLLYHASKAGLNELCEQFLLRSFYWLTEVESLEVIVADIAENYSSQDMSIQKKVTVVLNALRLSSVAFRYDNAQLASQLVGRLPQDFILHQQAVEAAKHIKGISLLSTTLRPATSPLLRILNIHSSPVSSLTVGFTCQHNSEVCFSAGSNDGKVVMSDLSNGEHLNEIETPLEGSINTLALSDSGNFLAVNNRIYDLKSNQLHLIINLPVEGSDVRDSAFSRLGLPGMEEKSDEIIAFCYRHEASLWHVNSGEMIVVFQGHRSDVQSIIVSPLTYSYDYRKKFNFWKDDKDWNKLIGIKPHEKEAHLTFDRSLSKLIATGSIDSTVKIWNLNGDLVGTLSSQLADEETDRPAVNAHEKWVQKVEFSPDASFLASIDTEYCCLWDVKLMTLVKKFRVQRGYAETLAFHPDAKLNLLAVSGPGNRTDLWSLREQEDQKSFKLVSTLEGHERRIFGLAFSSDGRQIISGSSDNTVLAFDIVTALDNSSKSEFPEEHMKNKYLETSDEDIDFRNRRGEVIDDEEAVVIIRPGNERPNAPNRERTGDNRGGPQTTEEEIFQPRVIGKREEIFRSEAGFLITDVAFHPNGNFATFVGFNGRVRVVDTVTAEILYDFQPHRRFVETVQMGISKPFDKTIILTGGSRTDNKLNVFHLDIEAGEGDGTAEIPLHWLHQIGHRAGIKDLSFHPDGTMVAVAGGDRMINIYDTNSFEKLHALRAHHALMGVDFCASGEFLLSGHKMVQLWDWKENKDIMCVFPHDNLLECLRFSKQGLKFATSDGKSVSVYTVNDVPKKKGTGTRKKETLLRTFDMTVPEDKSGMGMRAIRNLFFSNDGSLLQIVMKFNGTKVYNLETGDETLDYNLNDFDYSMRYLNIKDNIHVIPDSSEAVGFTSESPVRFAHIGPERSDGSCPGVIVEGRTAHIIRYIA